MQDFIVCGDNITKYPNISQCLCQEFCSLDNVYQKELKGQLSNCHLTGGRVLSNGNFYADFVEK